MGEWKEYQLDELASVTGGKRLPLGAFLTDMPTSHPYIRTRDLAGNKVDANALQFVPDDVFPHIKQYIVTAGDIIVSVVGTIGLCAMIPEELHNASLTENCNRISGFKTSLVSPEYLFFYLTGSVGQDELRQRTVGSTQPKLPMYNLREMPILLPPVEEQRAIASVLSSLDAKVDLLHRQNKTLEAMAETLFRQWFVEEAEEGRPWDQLGNHVEVLRGLSYTGAGLCEKGEGVPMHNLNSVRNGGGYKYEGIKYYAGEYKERHVVRAGDVIVANTDLTQNLLLIGCPAIVPMQVGTESVYSHHLYKLDILNPALSNMFVYQLLLSADVRDQITGATNGSTVNMLPKDGIEMANFQMPPIEKIQRFNAIAAPLHQKQEKNYIQIQTLIAQRDTLLPKLMSGEVRVESIHQ